MKLTAWKTAPVPHCEGTIIRCTLDTDEVVISLGPYILCGDPSTPARRSWSWSFIHKFTPFNQYIYDGNLSSVEDAKKTADKKCIELGFELEGEADVPT